MKLKVKRVKRKRESVQARHKSLLVFEFWQLE